MAYLNLTPSLKTTRVNAILTAIGASATIAVWSGTIPSNPSVAPAGTLLATLTCSATFGTVSGQMLTANAITAANAVATGTAAFVRINSSTPAGIVDMDVTATGSGGDIQLNTTSITSGLQVAITSLTITEA